MADLKLDEEMLDEKPIEAKPASALTIAALVVGLLAGAGGMKGVDLASDTATVQEAIDTLTAQGKILELVEVKDQLALATDGIKPAYSKITPARDVRDSTGKVIGNVKADTVQVAAAPMLAGFPDGKSDYAMAVIVPAGSTLRIPLVLDGKEVNSQIIAPKNTEWKIEVRAVATIH